MAENLVIEIPGGYEPEVTFYAGVDALLVALGLAIDPVEKGVKPHHSQYQERGPGGAFLPKGLKPAVVGRRLSVEERKQATIRARELVHDELSPRLAQHLNDWETKKLTPQEWFDRCSKDLKLFYNELYRYGKRAAGDPGLSLTPQDKAILKRMVDDELTYLEKFKEHLATGKGKMPYAERMQLYASASWEAYWTGFVMGDTRPNRQVRWRYGATIEHCGIHLGGHEIGCSDFEKLGWMDASTFISEVLSKGYAPRSGQLECTGVHCFLPGTIVQGRFFRGMRSFYDGQAVEVETVNGQRLRVTPSHPIATPRGFVAAGSLQEGDEVLCGSSELLGAGRIAGLLAEHDEYDCPTPIEQVFEALRLIGRKEVTPSATPYFHGDGGAIQGNIEIVTTDRKLPFETVPESGQERGNPILLTEDVRLREEATHRDFGFRLFRNNLATPGIPSGGTDSFDSFTVPPGYIPPIELRIGPAAYLDSSLDEPAGKNPTVDTAFFGELEERGSVAVLRDKVLKVRYFNFTGHVYDLQSPFGWILASGIVSSNCLCWLEERYAGEPQEHQQPPYPEFQEAPAPSEPSAPAASTGAGPKVGETTQAAPSPSAGVPIVSAGAATAADDAVHQVLTGTWPHATDQSQQGVFVLLGIPLWKREDALKDAVTFLFFLAKARAAASEGSDPAGRLERLKAIAAKGTKWLASRHGLSEADAEGVFALAASLRVFRVSDKRVYWESGKWSEPHLNDYLDLKAMYQEG